MAVKGSILGDIAGSQYEFEKCRPKAGLDNRTCELFTDRCVFTDDTIMTLAVKKAICENRDYVGVFRELTQRYQYVGYGSGFYEWICRENPEPYNSFGNGSAMRVSYIADHFDDLDDMRTAARESAVCTHNHPEGVKGAVVTAQLMWMARKGASRKELEEIAVSEYPSNQYQYGCDIPTAVYKGTYRFDATCQGSLPVAYRCFLESSSYEDCLRIAFGLHCDLDTVCCIAGGIAENFYGSTGFDDEKLLEKYLDAYLLEIVNI